MININKSKTPPAAVFQTEDKVKDLYNLNKSVFSDDMRIGKNSLKAPEMLALCEYFDASGGA